MNDGGNYSPEEIVSRFEGEITVSLIKQEHSGPASARNSGARIARGRYLAFTDDDCLPNPDWLAEFETCLKKNPESVVGGKTLNLLNNNLYSTASQLICELAYNHYNQNSERASFFCTNNMVVPKTKLLEIGGFDENFKTAEDRDFCKRWINHGLKMIYYPKAIIHHAHELNLRSFIEQHFKYGRGSYQFYKKNRGPSINYYKDALRFNFNPNNLVLYPFFKVKGLERASIVIPMLLWQIVNTSGFLFELINQKLGRGDPK